MNTIAASEAADSYARLKSDVLQAGILDKSVSSYVPLILFAFTGYLLSLGAIVLLSDYLPLGLACLSFTFFSVQVAGLMHDTGHRAVFASTRNNDSLGYLCSCLVGMVFDNWKARHNSHHAHPNQDGSDPDMEFPFIAFSEEHYLKKRRLERWIARR